MEATVVIPTYNKALYLELTLESLLHQTYDTAQYEVMVVDDGSTDETHRITEHFACQNWNFHSIKQINSGRSGARNVGIQEARGKYIIFIDDDCICNRNLIAAHLTRQARTRKKAVLGVRREVFTRLLLNDEMFAGVLREKLYSIDPAIAKEAIEKTYAYRLPTYDLITMKDVAHNMNKVHGLSVQKDKIDHLIRIAESQHACPWYFFMTANASIDKNMLIQVGQFDENFRGWGEEDAELGYRLFQEGVRFDAALDAIVYHQVHPRNRQVLSNEWLYNYIRFSEKHRTPEIYLKWQVNLRQIPMQQYEATIRQLEAGSLSDAEKSSIKECYDRFVAESMTNGISWPPKKAWYDRTANSE